MVCLCASIRLDRWTYWSSHGLTSSLNLAPEENVGMEVIPEVISMKALWQAQGRILVQNVPDFLVRLKDRMLLGQMVPATLVVLPNTEEEIEGKISIDRF